MEWFFRTGGENGLKPTQLAHAILSFFLSSSRSGVQMQQIATQMVSNKETKKRLRGESIIRMSYQYMQVVKVHVYAPGGSQYSGARSRAKQVQGSVVVAWVVVSRVVASALCTHSGIIQRSLVMNICPGGHAWQSRGNTSPGMSHVRGREAA